MRVRRILGVIAPAVAPAAALTACLLAGWFAVMAPQGRDMDVRGSLANPSSSVRDFDIGSAALDAIRSAFDASRGEIPYCPAGERCKLGTGVDMPQPSLPSRYPSSVGFAALALSAVFVAIFLRCVRAIWSRPRLSRSARAWHAVGAAFSLFALGLAAEQLARSLAFAGTSFSWPSLPWASDAAQAVFAAAASALSAWALASATSRTARLGAEGFPRLAAALVFAPSFPSIALYLAFQHPGSALANVSFLALNAWAVALSLAVPPAYGRPAGRWFLLATVLAVTYPVYAYMMEPRAAHAWEIFLICAGASAWGYAAFRPAFLGCRAA